MSDAWLRDRFKTRFANPAIEREFVGYTESQYVRFEAPFLVTGAVLLLCAFGLRAITAPESVTSVSIGGIILLIGSILYGAFAGRLVPGAKTHWAIPSIGSAFAYLGSTLYVIGTADTDQTINLSLIYCTAAFGIFFPQSVWPRILTTIFGLTAAIFSLKYFGTFAQTDQPQLIVIQIAGVMSVLMFAGIKHEISSRDAYSTRQKLIESQRLTHSILINVLPESVALQLKENPNQRTKVQPFDQVAVLFADIVGFTQFARQSSPEALADTLNEIFTRFDLLCERGGAEKIKTIGDAYMCIAGAPQQCPNAAERIADLALEFREAMSRFRTISGIDLHIRIGVHIGPVVAGILGRSRFSYDIWGDTVNIASRLESHGVVDTITASAAFIQAAGERFFFKSRGEVELKGFSKTEIFTLIGPTGFESTSENKMVA